MYRALLLFSSALDPHLVGSPFIYINFLISFKASVYQHLVFVLPLENITDPHPGTCGEGEENWLLWASAVLLPLFEGESFMVMTRYCYLPVEF